MYNHAFMIVWTSLTISFQYTIAPDWSLEFRSCVKHMAIFSTKQLVPKSSSPTSSWMFMPPPANLKRLRKWGKQMEFEHVHKKCGTQNSLEQSQHMVNWRCGLVVWIPRIPLWKGLLLIGILRIPNHQPKPPIYHLLTISTVEKVILNSRELGSFPNIAHLQHTFALT